MVRVLTNGKQPEGTTEMFQGENIDTVAYNRFRHLENVMLYSYAIRTCCITIVSIDISEHSTIWCKTLMYCCLKF